MNKNIDPGTQTEEVKQEAATETEQTTENADVAEDTTGALAE